MKKINLIELIKRYNKNYTNARVSKKYKYKLEEMIQQKLYRIIA
jgi:hypothetical protein